MRFTKSILTERMYDYNHAIQVKEDGAPIWSDIQRLRRKSSTARTRNPTRRKRRICRTSRIRSTK